MEEKNVNEVLDGETSAASAPAESSEFFEAMDTDITEKVIDTSAPSTAEVGDTALDTVLAADTAEVAEEQYIENEKLVAEVGVPEDGFKFEPMNFADNLRYMGIGMLGIFVVIGVIMGVTALLNKVFKD